MDESYRVADRCQQWCVPFGIGIQQSAALVLDKQAPSPDLSITFPFQIQSQRPPSKDLAEIKGNQILYVKTLSDKDRATTQVRGFGDTAKDYDIRVENKKLGVGYHVTGDRPLEWVAGRLYCSAGYRRSRSSRPRCGT